MKAQAQNAPGVVRVVAVRRDLPEGGKRHSCKQVARTGKNDPLLLLGPGSLTLKTVLDATSPAELSPKSPSFERYHALSVRI